MNKLASAFAQPHPYQQLATRNHDVSGGECEYFRNVALRKTPYPFRVALLVVEHHARSSYSYCQGVQQLARCVVHVYIACTAIISVMGLWIQLV